jgi:hypothetical protein
MKLIDKLKKEDHRKILLQQASKATLFELQHSKYAMNLSINACFEISNLVIHSTPVRLKWVYNLFND